MGALARLDGVPAVAARDVARLTGQSSDGAAYTLRSLVARGLARADAHDGDRWLGYQLTAAGWKLRGHRPVQEQPAPPGPPPPAAPRPAVGPPPGMADTGQGAPRGR